MKAWQHEASPDIADVKRWLRRGLRIGMTLEGLLALDFDPESFGFHLEFGHLPSTWRQRTGGGGQHWLYRLPAMGEATSFRTMCPWKRYPEGNLDIKTGPAQFIVLYPPEGERLLPRLEQIAELPDKLAAVLPRGVVLNGVGAPYSPEAWAALDRSTAHYRPNERTAAYLLEDRERLANSREGEQNALMNTLGYKWGCRVRDRFVSLGLAYFRLCEGAGRMRAWREGEPWDGCYIQDRLRTALLAGHRTIGGSDECSGSPS